MAKFYNKNISEKERTFKVGDRVMDNTRNIKTKRKSKKLDHRMKGQFKVKRLIRSNAYELALLYGVGKAHPVYYISFLELYNRNDILGGCSPSQQPAIHLGDDIWEVTKVLALRV